MSIKTVYYDLERPCLVAKSAFGIPILILRLIPDCIVDRAYFCPREEGRQSATEFQAVFGRSDCQFSIEVEYCSPFPIGIDAYSRKSGDSGRGTSMIAWNLLPGGGKATIAGMYGEGRKFRFRELSTCPYGLAGVERKGPADEATYMQFCLYDAEDDQTRQYCRSDVTRFSVLGSYWTCCAGKLAVPHPQKLEAVACCRGCGGGNGQYLVGNPFRNPDTSKMRRAEIVGLTRIGLVERRDTFVPGCPFEVDALIRVNSPSPTCTFGFSQFCAAECPCRT